MRERWRREAAKYQVRARIYFRWLRKLCEGERDGGKKQLSIKLELVYISNDYVSCEGERDGGEKQLSIKLELVYISDDYVSCV